MTTCSSGRWRWTLAGRTLLYRHLLVDEFQDINETQYRLVRAWSAQRSRSLSSETRTSPSTVSGGRTGSCFQRLRVERPELREIRLVENYRSTPEVLEAAAPVIEKNPGGCAPPAPQPALRPGGTDGEEPRMPSLRGCFSPRRSAV